MAGPKVSKVTEEDAQEWLASLKQVGQGWYRQVALAVKANAHKSLGMDRREFAQQIGQKLIDPREAIIELHREGMSQAAIEEILAVGHHTVYLTLLEAGEIEATRTSIAAGGRAYADEIAAGSRDSVDSTADEVDEEVQALEEERDRLEEELAEAKGQTERDTKDLREALEKAQDKIEAYQKAERERLLAEREAAEEEESEEDRERRQQEAEAFAEEAMEPVNALAAAQGARTVVGLLEEATETLEHVIEKGVTAEIVRQIGSARDAFNTEFAVAEAMASQEE